MILLDPLARPVIAHRGASGHFPENTLLAFHEARAGGADALEVDVRLTADAVPVVLHDSTIDRTTDGRGAVAEIPLAALREFDAGRGERIPTLSQTLETFPDVPIIVEVKVPEASAGVVELVRQSAAADRVLIGSFLFRAVTRARGAGVATAASRPETSWFWAASRMGLAPPLGCRAFTVPERSGRIHVVDRRFVRSAERRGWPVHVWTVDDPAHARRLRAIGVAGIITNFPERMVRLP